MRWNPQRWYSGMDVVVLGGGPSLRNFHWKRLVGLPVVGCNDAYRLGTSVVNVCVFGDLPWWNVHRESLLQFSNPIVTNQPALHTQSDLPILTMKREGYGLHTNALGWNMSTGATGINLTLVLGARRVLLLGFDCKKGTKGQTNWHLDNINKPNESSYKRFINGFHRVAEALPKVFPKREIINLGPDSVLDVFPKGDLDEWIR